jgi:hypothetical protein
MPANEIRCPRCQGLLDEATPCAECEHPFWPHHEVNGAHCMPVCDCEGYRPSPCADCVREAKDEAAYDERYGISADDRRR